jgi:hypothetical protein
MLRDKDARSKAFKGAYERVRRGGAANDQPESMAFSNFDDENGDLGDEPGGADFDLEEGADEDDAPAELIQASSEARPLPPAIPQRSTAPVPTLNKPPTAAAIDLFGDAGGDEV